MTDEIAITEFSSVTSAKGDLHTGTLDEILEYLLAPLVVEGPTARELAASSEEVYDAQKRKLSLWSGSVFRGNLRRNSEFEGAFIVGFDLDGLADVSESQVRSALSPYEAFAYTTSRSTAGAMRWRAGIILQEPVTSLEDFEATQASLAAKLTSVGAVGSKEGARQFYYPRTDPELVVFRTHGSPAKVVRGQASAYVSRDVVTRFPLGEERIAALVEVFRAHWLPGDKYELSFAISGTLAQACFRADDALAILSRLGDDHERYASDVDRAYRIAEGEETGRLPGWTKLGSLIGDDEKKVLTIVNSAIKIPMPVKQVKASLPLLAELAERPVSQYEYDLTSRPDGDITTTDLSHLMVALSSSPEWEGVLRWNDFANRLEVTKPPCKLESEIKGGLSKTDVTVIRGYFEWKFNRKANAEDIKAAVTAVAKRSAYNPVQDYLRALPPGDPAILNGLARRLFGCEHELEDVFLRKFLVQAVNRIMKPGCQADTALVLYEPKGGLKKSTFVRELFGQAWSAPFGKVTMGDIESVRKLAGKWAFEVAEMSAMRSSQVEDIKAFLTTRTDYMRDLWDMNYYDRDRQCVLVGTTNDKGVLHDSAHARRFWICDVKQEIDIPWLIQHRDALWAAAYALRDTQYWLTPQEAADTEMLLAAFKEADSWEDTIEQFCCGRELVTVKAIWEAISGEKEGKCGRAQEMRIATVLRGLKCEQKRIMLDSERCWRWVVPDSISKRKLKQVTTLHLVPGNLPKKGADDLT